MADKKTKAKPAVPATIVACAIVVRGDRVLVTRRGGDMTHKGRWEFPGGKPIGNETAEECIIRRVREEVGLNVSIAEVVEPYEIISRDNRYFKMCPFFCLAGDEIATPEEHSRVEWFMPIQLMRLPWPPSDIPIIDEIVHRVINRGDVL